MSAQNSGDGLDSYLFHVFDTSSDPQLEGSVGFESTGGGGSGPSVPLLVRINSASWNPAAVPGFQQRARLGNIVVGHGSLMGVQALRQDPAVVSVEVSREGGHVELTKSVSHIKASPVHVPPVNERGSDCIIAIIDGGFDVLHEAFRDEDGKTRILAVWDQTDPHGPPPDGFDFGTLHTRDQIDGYIANDEVPSQFQLGQVTDMGGNPLSGPKHGTHVASIAGGREAGEFKGGVAPEARFIFIVSSLTTLPGSPVSLGYSASHVSALDFIGRLAVQHDLPVAVNVSQGMNAGAHDGTTLLELAFDEFSGGGVQPGRVVVKSAGNENGHGGHALVEVAPGAVEKLKWEVTHIHNNQDFIELWFSAGNEMAFRLVHPNSSISDECSLETPQVSGNFEGGNRYNLSYTRFHHDNGDSRVVVTVDAGAAMTVATGGWSLRIEAKKVVDKTVHAWLERNTARALDFSTHRNDDLTLSVPGTARSVITVAAVNAEWPLEVNDASSRGPTRDGRNKPDVVAPGTAIIAARAGTKNDVITSSGTSMAAPHVSGAIALLMSQRRKLGNDQLINAMQVRAALTQTTQRQSAWTVAHGFGLVDVVELLKAFE